MTAIVEMFRAAAAPHGRNRFSCPLSIWDFPWELGHAFGWRPHGTTYVVPAKSMIEARSAAFASRGKDGTELLPGVLDEFIQFAYGGAFTFAISSDDAR
jgi:hypothetical protein